MKKRIKIDDVEYTSLFTPEGYTVLSDLIKAASAAGTPITSTGYA